MGKKSNRLNVATNFDGSYSAERGFYRNAAKQFKMLTLRPTPSWRKLVILLRNMLNMDIFS